MTDIIKENIKKYCDEDKISYQDLTSFNVSTNWGFQSGKIIFYALSDFPERIYFQTQLMIRTFEKEVNDVWGNAKRNNFIMSLREFALTHNISFDLVMEKDRIVGVKFFKIHYHSTIKKADFLTLFYRIASVQDIMNYKLSILLTSDKQKIAETQKKLEESEKQSDNIFYG